MRKAEKELRDLTFAQKLEALIESARELCPDTPLEVYGLLTAAAAMLNLGLMNQNVVGMETRQ
jgi:hypothetical protein